MPKDYTSSVVIHPDPYKVVPMSRFLPLVCFLATARHILVWIMVLFFSSVAVAQNDDLVIESEPKPGDKLGLPYAEAAAKLDDDVKELLDGVLLIYRSPALLGDRRKTLLAIGATAKNRSYFPTEGYVKPRFRDDLATAFLNRPSWSGYYFYKGLNPVSNRWSVKVEIRRDASSKADCISSRAVEGYMNIYWEPLFFTSAHHHSVVRSQWNRHSVAGGLRARPLTKLGSGIELGFVSGCLVRLDFSGYYNVEDLTNDSILN